MSARSPFVATLSREFAALRPPLRRWIAGSLSLVLAVTLVNTWDPHPAAAAPAPRTEAKKPDVPLERPDEAAARVTARIAKRRVEVTGLRTEYAQTFANPDGTLTLEQSARPVRVAQPDGSWRPVDTTLKVAADGSVSPGATTVGLRFSGGSGPLATISDHGRSASLAWTGTLPAPVLDGSAATYREVLPGVDLRLTADVDGFTQVLVVKTREAAKDPRLGTLRFALSGRGVTTKTDARGNLHAVDGAGKPVFLGAAPTMWDNSRLVGSEDRSLKVRSKGPGTSRRQASMRTKLVGATLEVTPDARVLADPATEFPVYLDPGFTSAKLNWTGVWTGNPDQSYWNSSDVAKVGSPNNGTYKMRPFFTMNTNGLQGKKILTASFNTSLLTSASCTPAPVDLGLVGSISPATTWNNQPSWWRTLDTETVAKGAAGCPAGGVAFNAVSAVEEAAAKGWSAVTLGLRAPNENTTAQWKTFANNPTMWITYNSYPTQPNHFTFGPCYADCGIHPARLADARPTFTARTVDPDAGQKVRLEFEIFQGTTVVQRGYTGWGTTGQLLTWRPGTALQQGVTYGVHVRGNDGSVDGPWSAAPTFVVDTTKPTNAVVASADYPAGQWSKAANQAGTFTLTAPGTADLGGFSYGLDQPAPTGDVRATGSSASVSVTPTTDGPHSLFVQTRDKAGNRGPNITEYKFFVGKGAIVSPATGAVVANKTAVAIKAPSDRTGATVQWRRGDADTWAIVPTADVSLASGGGSVSWPLELSGQDFPKLNWNVAKTVNDAELGDEPLDGPLQVRVAFAGGEAGFSGTTRFTLDRDMGSAAGEEIGPGSVNLLTGNATLSDTDASVDSYGSDLTVSRTFNTREADKDDPSGMFGKGWISGVAVEDAEADYTRLTVTGSLVQVGLPEGETIGFTRNGNGSFTPEIGSEDLTLSYSAGPNTYTLKDLEGTVSTFGKPAGAADYKPTAVTTPGNNQTTTYGWETVTVDGKAVTRPTRMVAPAPAGVTCGATLVRGCRGMSFSYTAGAAPKPTGDAIGEYPNRVASVSMTAWDPDASPAVMKTITVTRYAYDANGRLRQVWDPRLDYTDAGTTKHLADRYDYNGDGILRRVTPSAEEPWELSFTTLPGDSGKGRLAQVSRSALDAGTAKSTIVYRVPVSGDGAPYDLSESQTKRWGQAEAPTDATAVFPADQVPGGDQSGGELPAAYDRASVVYLDANGMSVNGATPGGGIATTVYDWQGNLVRSLTAGNRQRALDAAPDDDASTEAGLADALSSLNVHDAGGQLLLETFGPEHDIAGGDGTVRARTHTVNVYDEGAPATGGPFQLVTTTTTGARVTGATADIDTRVTKTAYDWTLRQPTAVTEDPGGLNQTTRTSYDATTSLVLSTTAPEGGTSTNTPATRVTTYYTAGANTAVPECGNRPEWANLACRAAPGGQPAGTPLPVTVTTYDLFNQVRVVTEKAPAGTMLRTTTTTYDGAGRAILSQQVGAAGTGEPLPATKTVYEPNTGRGTKVQSIGVGGAVVAEIVKAFDGLGRQTSYTDADGNTSTTTYDLLSRPATTSDGKGSQTLSYDGDKRGVLTKVVDSQAGTFTATYDADGSVDKQVLPNGIEARTETDEAGTAATLTYTKPGCGTDDCVLFADTAVESIHGQQVDHASTLSSQTYGYDRAGRLTAVADRFDGQCTTRTYAFSPSTNRNSESSYQPGEGGACQTTTADPARTWSYDTADRVTSAGYVYDALGRTTTVPAADTQNAAGGDLTASYHVSDLVRSITQAGRTTTYALDIDDQRIRSWTDVSNGVTTTRKHHYDGDGDNPAWTDEGNGQYSRVVSSIGGDLTAIRGADGNVEFQLGNLHGDVVATASSDLATQPGLLATLDSTEYGLPRDPAAAGARRYGWLGAKQRASDTPAGITLMGVRLYNPVTGRFLSTDPVPGGSCNSYEYTCADPINSTDLDGKRKKPKAKGSWGNAFWRGIGCSPTRCGFFRKGNRNFVMTNGRPGIHWKNHQRRLEWDKRNKWHFNRGSKHYNWRTGYAELKRHAASRSVHYSGRFMRFAGRWARSGGPRVPFIMPNPCSTVRYFCQRRQYNYA